LRGKTNEDVIFHGSKGHDKARYAEITLVFDNQHHLLHHEAKEVSVTRRLTRGTGNNEYFINEEPCRLKDIQEMFLDTGLSKGSLGIISQGTVQWFVEAKPEDRRTIFEDAAGIGLYTKKKEESNAQLARANDNLIRVTDIVNELGKDVRKLIKQAEKAQIYAQKHKELMHLDLTLLVKDLRYFKERLIKIDAQLNTARNELSVYEPDLKQIEQSLVFAREKAEIADQTIETLMQNLNEIIQEISTVELQKHSVQTKLQNDITSGNVEKKALAYRELITTSKFELEQLKERINKLQDEINTYSEVIEGLNTKRNTLTESNSKSAIKLAEIRMQVKAIQDEINSHSSIAIGPRTVIDYKQTLFGICGLVKDFVNVNKEYEPAILTVLGKNTQNVIVNDERDAKHAIDFLRRNKSGKATFLPISSIKSREIKPELLEALKTVTGYINIAVNLVQTDARFHHIMSFLLGNVIVCQDLESAHKASKITYQLYRVVTLDGDVVNAGGSIVGGYDRKSIVQSIDLPKRLEELNSEFQTIDQQLNTDRLALENINTELGEITAKQNEKRIMQSRYEQTSKITQEQLYKYEMDYEQLSKTHKLADKTSQ
jgi:chromosome segregation protein